MNFYDYNKMEAADVQPSLDMTYRASFEARELGEKEFKQDYKKIKRECLGYCRSQGKAYRELVRNITY